LVYLFIILTYFVQIFPTHHNALNFYYFSIYLNLYIFFDVLKFNKNFLKNIHRTI
jgi:hypothetical protein